MVGLFPEEEEPVPIGAVPLGKAELMLEVPPVGLFPEDAETEPVPMGAVPLGKPAVLLADGYGADAELMLMLEVPPVGLLPEL